MKSILIIFISLLALKSYGQKENDYVILTFVSETKGSNHPARTDHWIVKIDSINEVNNSVPLFPTYLNIEYSKNCFDDCCNDEKIDLLTITTSTKYDFNNQHKIEQKSLLNIVNENKILIQKIRIKWTNYKAKDIIKIYATPIRGTFCECGIYGLSLKFADGQNKVFIPKKGFSLINGFWNTDEGNYVKWFDYSKITPQNYH
jgi:hypothetical protein